MFDNFTDNNVMELAQNMNIEGLSKKSPEGEPTPAEIVADLINVMRMDIKMLADVHDINVEATRMTEDRAAELLSAPVSGRMDELIETFNDLEDKRNKILREVMSEEDYESYQKAKRKTLYTNNK